MEIKRYIEFIQEARKRGFKDSVIKKALLEKRWPEKEINHAFNLINKKEKVQIKNVKNSITIFLDKNLTALLEKRAKKNLFTLPEQIEDILRRSTLSLKKKTANEEKLDDKLVAVFSRKIR